MISALVNGIIGAILTVWVSTRYFDFSMSEGLKLVLFSNFAGAFTLGLTLWAERTTWIKDRILTNSIRTWALFSFAYFLPLLAFEPRLKDLRVFGGLVIPVIFCTGFMIIAYGPIQDFLTRRSQNRARQKLDRLSRSE
jgi:hypothetical protein